MPASSADIISLALRAALTKKGLGQSDGNSDFQDQLNAATKQIFLHDIEYECSNAPHSFVLNHLKSKYVTIINRGKTSGSKKFEAKIGTMAHGRSEDKLEEPRVTLWAPDKVVLGWRKSFPPGAGMINLGNTCYMNSSLQALFHIPSLVNWLLEEINTHIPNCEANTQNASFCSICGMMRTLKLALERGNNVIKPTFIHSKLKSIGKTLMYGRQEDAHEFIKLLLDHMEKSFLQLKRATKLDHRSKETTPLNQIFGGYLRQQVICPLCCYVSTTFSHFQDLVLDIRSVGSVDEALNLYFRKETLDADNAYKCEKCHKRVPATKRHLIERAPHVLLLQLKRFTISGGKITKHVNIQKNIDISRYVNGMKPSQPNGAGPYFYRLVSMVIHLGGSQHGGHYTAVAEASNNSMFEFDDASVRPISVHSALLRNPYILFYEMVRKPKGVPGLKQVIRQSSEKTLLRQSSSEKISKPLPTSLSTSCMWNGVASATTDNIGEAVNRNGIVHGKKSPLLSQKERERVSFGIKLHSNSNRSYESGTTPFRSGSSAVHDSTVTKTSQSTVRPSSASLSSSGFKPNLNSSLVPYNDDSDDPEESRDADKITNGHTTTRFQENGHIKVHGCYSGKSWDGGGSCSTDGHKSSRVSSDKCDTDSLKSKGGDKSASNSLERNIGAKDDNANSSNSLGKSNKRDNVNEFNKANEDKSPVASTSGSLKLNGKISTAFLPRSVQAQINVNSKDNATSIKMNGHAKILIGANNQKEIKSTEDKEAKASAKENGNAHLNDNTVIKYKQEHGWIVTDSVERSPSDSSICSSTSSQGFFVIEKQKARNKHPEKVLKERESFNGWVVTVKNIKPDLEKSLSQDCVLPARAQVHDQYETASLKSKESFDSNRSDKSSRLMKRSLFSFLSCVSSSHSPELSPDDEQQNSVIENKSASPVLAHPKKKDSADLTAATSTSQIEGGNAEDNVQTKRNRDKDEQEPTSPSKKSRPESGKISSGTGNDSESESSGSCRDVSERLMHHNLDNDEGEYLNSKQLRSPSPHELNSPSCNRNKTERSSSTRDEENFSMEEKKSRHKRKHKSFSFDANTKSNCQLSPAVNGENQERVGYKLSHIKVVEWNRHVNDLSDSLSTYKGSGQQKVTKETWMWDGSTDTSVVSLLKRAGELPFGVQVNTWEDGKSVLEKEVCIDRNEAKKRSADDLYNEEIDHGKVSKKRFRNDYTNDSAPKENPFQKYQNDYINNRSHSARDNYRRMNYANNNNIHQYYRKFHNNQQGSNWAPHLLPFRPQNQFRRGFFHNHKNSNHWFSKSEDRQKFFGRRRDKFRYNDFNH